MLLAGRVLLLAALAATAGGEADAAANESESAAEIAAACADSFESYEGGSGVVALASDEYAALGGGCQHFYRFQPAGWQRVQIAFGQFNMHPPRDEPNDAECARENDHMTAYVSIDGELSEIGTFCGSAAPPQLMSAGGDLTLEFVFADKARSKDPDGRYGHNFTYNFLSHFGIEAQTRDDRFPCGFIFNSSIASNGTLYSPNYPGYYPRNTDCHYEFHGAADERVRIHFTYFDVEGHGGCGSGTHSDYVTFSDFRTEDRGRRRYCGGDTPMRAQPIQSDGSFFRMLFHSNAVHDATGFYAKYTFERAARRAPKP